MKKAYYVSWRDGWGASTFQGEKEKSRLEGRGAKIYGPYNSQAKASIVAWAVFWGDGFTWTAKALCWLILYYSPAIALIVLFVIFVAK